MNKKGGQLSLPTTLQCFIQHPLNQSLHLISLIFRARPVAQPHFRLRRPSTGSGWVRCLRVCNGRPKNPQLSNRTSQIPHRKSQIANRKSQIPPAPCSMLFTVPTCYPCPQVPCGICLHVGIERLAVSRSTTVPVNPDSM